MMKKIFYISISILVFGEVSAQIGIGVDTPQAPLHIDPKSDTSGATGTTDDVAILAGAEMGIGTITPTANLDINSSLRIVDGNQNTDYYIGADENGVGTWTKKALPSRVQGNTTSLGASGGLILRSAIQDTGATITLPPGSWNLTFTASFQNIYNNTRSSVNLWWQLKDSGGSVIGTVLSGNGSYQSYLVATANYVVNPTVTTTYKMWGGAQSAGSATVNVVQYTGEGRIWAVPIQ